MIRTHALVWLGLVTAAIGFLFYTSHQAGQLEAALDARNRAIFAEQEAIRVLRAEWAYLNEPTRLREMARRYTELGPALPTQVIADLAAIPAVLPAGGPAQPVPPRKPAGRTAPPPPAMDDLPTPPLAALPPEPPRAATAPAATADTLGVLLAEFRARRAAGEGASR